MSPEQETTLQFEIVKRVTVPFLVIEGGVKYFIKFDSLIEDDQTSFTDRVRQSKKNDGEEQSKEKIQIASITNLQDDQRYKLVCHSVLKSTLEETYKDGEYVGRAFQVLKSKERSGRGSRKYFNWDIAEIKLKTTNANTAPPDTGSAAKSARK